MNNTQLVIGSYPSPTTRQGMSVYEIRVTYVFEIKTMIKQLDSQFGQVVMGPPGAGKSTYVKRQAELLLASRSPVVVNLDPGSHAQWGSLETIDIRKLVTSEQVAALHHLGPNGSVVFCLEFLDSDKGRAWLLNELLARRDSYFLLDLPGQVELVTHHPSMHNIIKWLTQTHGMRLVGVNLLDASMVTDPERLVSLSLLSLTTMMRLELPHLNVFNKSDLLDPEQLQFPLDFYTRSPNFSLLAKTIPHTAGLFKLFSAVCQLLDDYAQVAFELISITDDESLARLLGACDRAIAWHPTSGVV